jgi:hypothetical protein
LFDVPELEKPADQWCRHCKPGKGGCSIYEQRAPVCSGFKCLWLDPGSPLGEDCFPKTSGIIAYIEPDRHSGERTLHLLVDPQTPGRWHEEPFASFVADVWQSELRVVVKSGPNRHSNRPL